MSNNAIIPDTGMLLAEEKRKVRLLKEIGRAQRSILMDVQRKVVFLQQLCLGFQIVLGNTQHYIETVRPDAITPPFVRKKHCTLKHNIHILLHKVTELHGSDEHAKFTPPRLELTPEE